MKIAVLRRRILFAAVLLATFVMTKAVWGQTTAFTYQGKLTDAGNPANGNYDMEFKLFDALSGGTQQGAAITNPTVAVAGGIFAVNLDFGANVFTGASRYLEISVRPTGSLNPYTLLAPRQPITSSPYAIQTINALQLDGLPASRYVAADVNGNVGIGTPTPLTKLTVQTGDSSFGFSHTNGTTLLSSYLDTAGAWFGTTTNDPLLFYTNSSFRMAITDSGNVGIGTYSPSQLLHINNFFGNAAALVQTPTNSFAQYHLKSGETNPWIIGTQDNFAGNGLLFRNGVTDLMAIQPGGNVGIGTTSPQSKLAVQSSAHGITQTDGIVTVGTYVDSTGGWLGTRSNHPLHFFTGNSLQQMTLSTSGALGIGTTTPTLGRLHVRGNSLRGVYSSSDFIGVWGDSAGEGNTAGVYGTSTNSDGGFGVIGFATGGGNPTGVFGESTASFGYGVFARAPARGVWGKTTANGQAVYGDNGGSDSVGYAGYFFGRTHVTGFLSKGAGAFKIDHPLDPENKYLLHSFVESPDMMNIYNGNVTTDEQGYATVTMPDWFEALNQDFRYQLTVIGQFAQAIIASKIRENRFTIKTDKSHVEVSWQVTGIRHDAYARANRIQVEQEKPKDEAGYYLHPQAFGQPEEKGIEQARQLKEPRQPPQQKTQQQKQ